MTEKKPHKGEDPPMKPGADETPADETTSVTQAGGEAAAAAAGEAGEAVQAAGDEAEKTADKTAVTKAADATAVTTAVGAEAEKTAAGPVAVAVAAPAPRRRGGRLHTVLIAVLLVLSCLAVVITGVTWWAHYTTLNTSGYMKIVGPIGKDPAAIKSLSEYITTQVVTATDLQARAEAVLPEQAKFLAGPLTAQVQTFIQKETYKLLSTDKAYQIWYKVNEVAHDKVVGLLRGQNTLTYVKGSDVKLNVLPLISEALVWLEGKLPGALSSRINVPVIDPATPPEQAIQQVSDWSGKALPADFGQITLLESDALGPAQTAISIFDKLMWILPLIVAILVALTIWLSHKRRTTIIVLGIGVAVALIITHVVVNKATEALINSLEIGTTRNLVGDVINASLDPLTTLTIWIVVVAAVVAVVAWFVGRRDLRHALAYAGRATASKADEVAKSDTATTRWMRHNTGLLRVVGLVVLLILLLVSASSWTWIIVLLILLALYQVAVSYVAGEWPFPERAPHETAE
jgi:hypothetical protein